MQQAKTYYNLKASTSRFHVEEGGTRSGKTYSILMGLAELCWMNKGAGLLIDVVRVNGPAIDAGPLRDWREILTSCGWWAPEWRPKKRDFNLFGNEVNFFSVDQPYKMRGRKRNILYMNEGNLFPYDAFHQLNMRTTDRVIIDYNPHDIDHWLYEKVIPRPNCVLHRTTYKDNPHLPKELVEEIEGMEGVDDWYWQVYGLGNRAANPAQIFKNWELLSKLPAVVVDAEKRERPPTPLCLGLDFGFSSHPSALIAIWEGLDREIFGKELLYQTGLTNAELADIVKAELALLELDDRFPVVCDSAEPKSIRELRQKGINAYAVEKGPDSVRQGIQFVQQHKIKVVGSENFQKELQKYRWRIDSAGNPMQKIAESPDHLIDAFRYGLTWAKQGKFDAKYAIGGH